MVDKNGEPYDTFYINIQSIAGCPVENTKQPYYFMGLWYSKNICFALALLTGLVICFAGKPLWKLVHFISGFGLILTVLLIIMYPAFVRKGYRLNWQMWVCYPLCPIFALAFGFFLTHYPRGGCWWLGFWVGYLIGSNIFYNVPFSFIATQTRAWYWIIVAITEVGMLLLLLKTKPLTKNDKTFHLQWQAPIFGGFLIGLSWLIYAQNSPHSYEYALIRIDLPNDFKGSACYLYALLTWILFAILGFVAHKTITPKIAEKIKDKYGIDSDSDDSDDSSSSGSSGSSSSEGGSTT